MWATWSVLICPQVHPGIEQVNGNLNICFKTTNINYHRYLGICTIFYSYWV